MNKFDLINKVLVSDLKPEDKCLLIELIVRADDRWESRPTVGRLCKVRGIKHEKNFKGADHYLPGLVTKIKKGRRNWYTINTPAVAGLLPADVVLKQTPAVTDTPSVAGVNTPAVADNTPAVEGANTTSNTTRDTTEAPVAADATTDPSNLNRDEPSSNALRDAVVYTIDPSGVSKTLPNRDTPAVEGVLPKRRFLSPGEKKDFDRAMRLHGPTEEQRSEALRIVETTRGPQDIYEAATEALRASGAVLKEVEQW